MFLLLFCFPFPLLRETGAARSGYVLKSRSRGP